MEGGFIFAPRKRKGGTSDLGHNDNQQSQGTVVAWELFLLICYLNKVWDQEQNEGTKERTNEQLSQWEGGRKEI